MILTKVDISSKITELVSKSLNIEQPNIEATFEELGADSLDMIEMIMKIEELFEIEITDDDAEKITNINYAIEYVCQIRNLKS